MGPLLVFCFRTLVAVVLDLSWLWHHAVYVQLIPWASQLEQQVRV